VFDGLVNAQLTYTTGDPSACTWYRYEQDPSVAVPVSPSDVQTSLTETVLTNIQAGYGYIVDPGSGPRHYVYVVDYIPVEYGDVNLCTECDVCNTLTLSFTFNAEDLAYYSATGSRLLLKRQYKLSWNTSEWNVTDKTYTTKAMSSSLQNTPFWSIIAPLTDTYFTVGDQFALLFEKTYRSPSIYKAVAVKTNADWVIQERAAENELNKVSATGELGGSAPLNVQFFSRPSEAVQSYVWEVFESADATGKVARHTDGEDLTHAFQEAGSFLVKVTVSSVNGTCKDSATFTAKISESFIDCPNFFTPRSSPGENDEFRVAYKSIISFKAAIVNRWGNVLFEWTDPALGWDGTYKGKAVSQGVYFYLIEAKGSDGIVYKKKGDINLLE
jgi:gliding motility-associated-like protein